MKVKKKICSRCKTDRVRWACRSCGAICCEHRCSSKTQSFNTDNTRLRVATCGACARETGRLAPR